MSAKAKPKIIPATMFYQYKELDDRYRSMEAQPRAERDKAEFQDVQRRRRQQGKTLGEHIFLSRDEMLLNDKGQESVMTDDGVIVVEGGGVIAWGQVEGEDRDVYVTLKVHRPSGHREFRINYDRIEKSLS
jgi:hypothetical protein